MSWSRRGRAAPSPVAGGESTPDRPPIVVERLTVHRGPHLALNEVTFALEPGTVTAVVGPNGAGKSSLFGALSRRLPTTSGTIDVTGEVAEVLQQTDIDDHLPMTVEQVVRIGRYPSSGLLRPMGRDDRRAIDRALEATEMTALRKRPISDLSGGQRQRALVAQGLAQDAPVLLLDEPTTGLDVRSQRQLLDIIRSEGDRGTTVLFSTHNLREADDADNLIVLACECVCCAPPVDAFADPAVTALFGASGPRWNWNAADAAASSDSPDAQTA